MYIFLEPVAVQSKERLYTLGAIYTREMLTLMKKNIQQGNYRLRPMFQETYAKIVNVDQIGLDENYFMNINFEEDYEKVSKLMIDSNTCV